MVGTRQGGTVGTRRLLEVGPVAVDVPAVAGVHLRGRGKCAVWSSSDIVRVTFDDYCVAVTEDWLLELRKY